MDQTNVDVVIPLFLNFVVTMYITVISIFIITCQNSWPTAFLLIPLAWLNVWYRVCARWFQLVQCIAVILIFKE